MGSRPVGNSPDTTDEWSSAVLASPFKTGERVESSGPAAERAELVARYVTVSGRMARSTSLKTKKKTIDRPSCDRATEDASDDLGRHSRRPLGGESGARVGPCFRAWGAGPWV